MNLCKSSLLIIFIYLSVSTSYVLNTKKLTRRGAYARTPLQAAFEDDKDGSRLEMPKENDGPKISVQDKVDGIIVKDRVRKSGYESSTQSMGLNTDQLFVDKEDNSNTKRATGSATFGGMTIETLQSRMQESPYRAQSWDDLPDQKEDLNGINPITTLAFSIIPMSMSYGLIQITTHGSQSTLPLTNLTVPCTLFNEALL